MKKAFIDQLLLGLILLTGITLLVGTVTDKKMAVDKVFDLKVVIPIEKKGENPELFEYFESASYECIAKEYKGSVDGIGNAWESMMNEAQSNSIALSPQNHCREVYKTWLGFDSSDNITELQTQI